MISSKKILEIVNPPLQINSIEHINLIVNSSACLTLVEMHFFIKIKKIIQQICDSQITGDIVIVGVFKGGCALYLKSLFEEMGIHRNWWLFDSFSGFNKNNVMYDRDIESLDL